jgi:hypothetical protein
LLVAGLVVVLAIVFIAFCAVIFVGAPYVPTLDSSTEQALRLLNLKPGQVFVDLGSGDGRVLAAASRRGLIAIGYELNPILVLASRWRLRSYKKAKVHWKSFWRADLSSADGVFVFLADLHMKRLGRLLSRQKRHLKVASHAFEIPGKKVAKQAGAVLLYIYE